MNNSQPEYERDLAHEADMEKLRREQLRNDVGDDELLKDDSCELDDDNYDPEQYDFEEDWEEDYPHLENRPDLES